MKIIKTNKLNQMSRHKVRCIQKSNRHEIHNIIEFIGGLNSNGTNWKVSQKRAIQGMESGKWEFYVEIDGKIANVIIATNNGLKYIKTESDNLESNNLLNLPNCP